MRDTLPNEQTGSRRRRTVEEAEAILERYFASGLTQRVFAERNGVSVSSLQYWLRRARRLPPAEGGKAGNAKVGGFALLEVELAEAGRRSASGAMRFEIEMPAGERLRVAGGFDAQELRCLLALLREEAH